MGLLSSMMGSAAGADIEKVTKQVEPFLLDDEKIDSAYKIFRDMIIFTQRRMITVDVQVLQERKKISEVFLIKIFSHFPLKLQELLIWMLNQKYGFPIVRIQLNFNLKRETVLLMSKNH